MRIDAAKVLAFGAAILASGCRGSADQSLNLAEPASDWSDTGSAPSGDTGAGGDPGPDDGLGSEEEVTLQTLRPAATGEHVFVANTERNTITRIAVPSLDVLTAPVGTHPVLVLTTADSTRAVTFNDGSDDVSVIDAATLEVTSVPVRENLNQMELSPDGRWALCYHDSQIDEGTPNFDGSLSYNEISLVDLHTLTHHDAVVGTFPHDVQFTADGGTAVVVSDDYLAVITLDPKGPVTERIAISSDLIDPPAAEEVLLDPQGRYAIVRQYGVDELVLVDLTAKTTTGLEVGDNPTDMDLTPDGAQAVVVARADNELWIYDMLDPTAGATVVAMPADEIFGSVVVSADGSQGLLYTTAVETARYGVWNRADDTITVRGLVKPLSSVGLSPDGGTALIFHPQTDEVTPPESPFYGTYALTLIDLSDHFANPIRLAGEPSSFASTEDGTTGFVIMDRLSYLEVLHYGSLLHDEIALPSTPTHLGVLPGSDTAFVSQQHDLGRISFFDPASQQVQTITGFELNGAIEYE